MNTSVTDHKYSLAIPDKAIAVRYIQLKNGNTSAKKSRDIVLGAYITTLVSHTQKVQNISKVEIEFSRQSHVFINFQR